MKPSIAALVSVSIVASPLFAQDRLYKKTDSDWEIWHESKSCAIYAYYGTGTRLRVSDRTDENQLYIWVDNDEWQQLRGKTGEVLTLYLNFPAQKRRHGIAAAVVPPPSLGYSGTGLSREVVLTSLAEESSLILEGKFGIGEMFEIETFELGGSKEAVTNLIRCSHDHFGAPVFSVGSETADNHPLKQPAQDDWEKYKSPLDKYIACVVRSARKFATSRETAPVVARSAVNNCYSLRMELVAALALDGISERRLEGIDQGLVRRAELEVVKLRSK